MIGNGPAVSVSFTRNRTLLNLARGMPCQLLIMGVCRGNSRTTVACHANWQAFGKGKGIKAHDWAMCHGCMACHAWLDGGDATEAEKLGAFLPAALRSYAALVDFGRMALADGAQIPGGEYADLDGSYRPAPPEHVDGLVEAMRGVLAMLESGALVMTAGRGAIW